MYCNNCGNAVADKAEICPSCGVRVREPFKSPADNPSHIAGAVGCCFPLVGIFMYLFWKDDKPKSAKLVCKWMISGTVALVIFYLFACILSVSS